MAAIIDDALVECMRAGDPDAFSTLYETYRPNVQRFIRSKVRDESEVDDLTQETFVEAFRSIHRFEGRSSLLTWLLGISRFVWLRSMRFASRWMVGSHAVSYEHDPTFDAGTEAHVDARRMLGRCERILQSRHSERDRWLFHLRYREHLPTREIAEKAGISIDVVKTSLHRTRHSIAQGLASSRSSTDDSSTRIAA